jgi:hypothetical protein
MDFPETAPPRTDVLISEVGPRDGLQSVARTLATSHKSTSISRRPAACRA